MPVYMYDRLVHARMYVRTHPAPVPYYMYTAVTCTRELVPINIYWAFLSGQLRRNNGSSTAQTAKDGRIFPSVSAWSSYKLVYLGNAHCTLCSSTNGFVPSTPESMVDESVPGSGEDDHHESVTHLPGEEPSINVDSRDYGLIYMSIHHLSNDQKYMLLSS